jgi:hypothetical protein
VGRDAAGLHLADGDLLVLVERRQVVVARSTRLVRRKIIWDVFEADLLLAGRRTLSVLRRILLTFREVEVLLFVLCSRSRWHEVHVDKSERARQGLDSERDI